MQKHRSVVIGLELSSCFTNLDLVNTKSVHPGYKAGQSCLSCSTHTDQQEMTLRLTEDSERGNTI